MNVLTIATLLIRKAIAFLVVMCAALLLGALLGLMFPVILFTQLANPVHMLHIATISERVWPLSDRVFRYIGGPPLREITRGDLPEQDR